MCPRLRRTWRAGQVVKAGAYVVGRDQPVRAHPSLRQGGLGLGLGRRRDEIFPQHLEQSGRFGLLPGEFSASVYIEGKRDAADDEDAPA